LDLDQMRNFSNPSEAAKKHDIKHGAVVSGVCTLKRTHLHYVNTNGLPPDNRYYVIDEPVEVSSISGLIVNYEPHLQ
jgi:predicted DNA-binding protein with PD1-like motif